MGLMTSINTELDGLRERLRILNTEFEREMRARGFEPSQADNVAWPAHLAALYAERERITAELAEMEGSSDD
jgi:hypothetical protein